MKTSAHKGLNQRGFIHHVIPVLAFIALFAIVGAYFLLRGSLAATVKTYVYMENTSFSNVCLSNVSGTATIEPCNPGNAAISNNNTGAYSTSQEYVEINGQCLTEGGKYLQDNGKMSFGSCSAVDNNQWQMSYPLIKDYRVLPQWCLGATTLGATLSVNDCTKAYYKDWKLVTVKVTTTSPAPAPSGGGSTGSPKPAPSTTIPISQYYKSSPQACYNDSYSTANVNTAYYCVAALQSMLNGMKSLDGYNQTLTIDGQFGNNTATSLTDYQKYQNKSLGNKPITALGQSSKRTWQFMCWSMHNHGWTTSATAAGQGYNYAECTTDGVKVGVKPT